MIIDFATVIAGGIGVGLLASMPPGPISILCIQRTLSGGRNMGFMSGLGAATADTTFAMIAVFTISYFTSFLKENETILQAVGALVIILLGFKIFYKKVQRPNRQFTSGTATYATNYLSVLMLTITNPAYLLFFMFVFTAVGFGGVDMDTPTKFTIIGGVFIGAAAWWFLLTWAINKLRKKFTIRSLWWLNKISGGLIVLLGIVAIIKIALMATKIIS